MSDETSEVERVAKTKIWRNESTPESRAFWRHVEAIAREVESWPEHRRALYQSDKRGGHGRVL